MDLLSNRAEKTARLVLLPASTEDPSKAPPGIYRLMVFLTCGSVTALFAALVIAYFWRRADGGFWNPIALPQSLWVSTGIILLSSGSFEAARRTYAKGFRKKATQFLMLTVGLGSAFLISQLASWKALVDRGAYLGEANPYSSFFYIFTGLHAAHLLGGLVAMGIVVMSQKKRREVIDATAYYWHFLGVLWIALFWVLSV